MPRPQTVLAAIVIGLAAVTSAASAEQPPSSDRQAATAAAPERADALPPANVGQTAKSATSLSGSLDGRTNYRALIEREATREGIAPEIAEAVMAVESGYNAAAIGGAGEIGLMQILPSTARMLGFAGTNAELAIPENNIHFGVTYLARAWRLARGDLCTAVMKYRAGHGETRFSYLSVNYCVAVRGKLIARGFTVTGSVPVATFGEPGGVASAGAGCRRRCIGSRVGSINLAALNTRLSAIVVQVRAGR